VIAYIKYCFSFRVDKMRQSEMWWVLATFGILGALVVEGRPAEDEVTESKVTSASGRKN
jgi:hypothetical protein